MCSQRQAFYSTQVMNLSKRSKSKHSSFENSIVALFDLSQNSNGPRLFGFLKMKPSFILFFRPYCSRATMGLSKEVEKVDRTFLTRDYPSCYGDPSPTSFRSTVDAVKTHRKIFTALGGELHALFNSENSFGYEHWIDFIITFWIYFVRTWPKWWSYKWYPLLKIRGLYVDGGRGISETKTSCDCFSEKYENLQC